MHETLTDIRFLSQLNVVCEECSRMRLCDAPCKRLNPLSSQNTFMLQKECKHSQLCLKGLN